MPTPLTFPVMPKSRLFPDPVTLLMGVESRSQTLTRATAPDRFRNSAGYGCGPGVDSTDIQTDYIHVDLSYNDKDRTIVEYYTATKAIQVLLKDASKFEDLLNDTLAAGANHIYEVEFSTSELRNYCDQARALAVEAATEKVHDLAAAGGLKVVDKPLTIAAYSYGGGSYYGRCCGSFYGSQMYQNVLQNVAHVGEGGMDSGVSVRRSARSA
jgi:uncharacterized protein YggE